MRALLHGSRADAASRFGRSERALRTLGVTCARLTPLELAHAPGEGAWLLAAGVWPARLPIPPPSSATGLPLCALGAVVQGEGTPAWDAALRATGGDFGGRLPHGVELASVWLAAELAQQVAMMLHADRDWRTVLAEVLTRARSRVVRWAPLDVRDDPLLRVAQVVTSLQHGGAERVALTLHAALGRRGLTSLLIPIGSPTRVELAVPEGCAPPLRLPACASRGERATALADLLAHHGVDVVHAHLLEPTELVVLTDRGLPVVATVHNQRPGWQPGTGELGPEHAKVLVGCCTEVAREIAATGTRVPVRSIRNGIDPASVAASADDAARLRRQFGIPSDALVLLCLANPRPQKRLARLPPVLAALRARCAPRPVHLVVAGSVGRGDTNAAAEREAFLREVARARLGPFVHEPGALARVGPALRAADVLVCTSAWEGLSLAWLEALAVGTRVVTTAVGGAEEVARFSDGLRTVAVAAGPEEFAEAILASVVPKRPFALTSGSMADACARLCAAVGIASPARDGLWLVTNNLATGGAQTSARRLLLELARRGLAVRAAVVDEDPAHPSPGRAALVAAGVRVHATNPVERVGAAGCAFELLAALRTDPPVTVLFWNLRPALRVMLAEALVGTRVVDVSPGEMWAAALREYFAKPRVEVACASAREYGALLDRVVVKHSGEAASAAELTGATVQVVRNGVPEAAAASGTRTLLRIGTLARLSPQKRLEELVAALRLALPRLPACEVHVGGDAERGSEEYARTLRETTTDLPLVWRGAVEADAFLAELDLFVMIAEPAGCPNASLEALARGLPVVATDHGGMREQVLDGVTGLLVPRADPAALAEAIVRLANDAPLRARLGPAGCEHVRSAFSLTAMVDAYARLAVRG